MEEAAIIDAVNNTNDGNCEAVAVALHNASKVQVPLPPLFLPVVIPYVGATPDITASTLPVATIVGAQTSNS